MMFENSVHFVLQGKGGIGKSFIASLIAQFVKSKDGDVTCFDTDQVNTTFAYYKSLNVEHIKITDESMVLDTKGFDNMLEKIIETEAGVVIDNGANTFAPLASYMIENDAFQLLNDAGKTVFIHTIVGGGDNLRDSVSGLLSLSKTPNAHIMLWLNEYFGSTDIDGKPFEQSKAARSVDEIYGTIRLHQRNAQTFGSDIRKLTAARLTVEEAMSHQDFRLMERQRIKTFSKDVFSQLEEAFTYAEEP